MRIMHDGIINISISIRTSIDHHDSGHHDPLSMLSHGTWGYQYQFSSTNSEKNQQDQQQEEKYCL